MKILPVAQGSVEWLEARAGIPTASEFDQLVSPKGEIRKGEMPKTYLAKKLAERWSGPLPGYTGFAAEQGQILEGEAVPWLEFEYGWKITRPGFITTDDGLIGCSPDALIEDSHGVEVKCPEAPTHIKYLLAGVMPADYTIQVQGGLYVTGLESWRFVSYRRHYPPLILHVAPEPKIQEALAQALAEFIGQMEESWQKLLELNGGPPPPRERMIFADEINRRQQDDPEAMGITP